MTDKQAPSTGSIPVPRATLDASAVRALEEYEQWLVKRARQGTASHLMSWYSGNASLVRQYIKEHS